MFKRGMRAQRTGVGRRIDGYQSARELLAQLRELARELPQGFDERRIAAAGLEGLVGRWPGDPRAAVYWRHEHADRMSLLATTGVEREAWTPTMSDQRWGVVARSAVPLAEAGMLTDESRGHCLIVPLRLDGEVRGLVGVERHSPPFDQDDVERAMAVADVLGVELAAAAAFEEVRSVAMVEERHRIAREIHDGVAQEIAALAVELDIAVRALAPDAASHLAGVRERVQNLASELRTDIFLLRSDIDQDSGLLGALTSLAARTRTDTRLTVVTEFRGGSHRLVPTIEQEVLRIAQEAVQNVRKHAAAGTLWLECRIDPPHLLLRVRDDGSGRVRDVPADSWGLRGMAERAERIGGELTIRDRVGGGTVVELKV